MSATIQRVTISSITEGQLLLNNHQAGRLLAMGSSWARIRLGLRISMNDSGGNMPSNTKLYAGFMNNPASSMTNGPLTAATSHFVGIRTTNSDSTSFNRSTSGGIHYAPTMFRVKKVAATETVVSGIGIKIPANGVVRAVIAIELTKGSPNFTVESLGLNTTGGLVDISYSQLLNAMEESTMSDMATNLNVIAGASAYVSNSDALAVNEGSNGVLNAVALAWPNLSTSFRFSEVVVAKYA